MKSVFKLDKLGWAANLAQLDEYRRNLLASPRHSDERRLAKHGFRVFSQADEDGILHEIFRRIGEGVRTFAELGASDGSENNSLFLMMKGWRGLWVEGAARKVSAARSSMAEMISRGQLRVEQAMITAANADQVVRKAAFPGELDLLSIDLDGNDYHILSALRSISPRVIVAEYNAKYPPDFHWVMEYDEAHRWDSSDYFGASLKALETLLAGRGYSLVGCNILGSNAFFVRSDLATEHIFCPPFTAENHYEPPRYFLRPAFDTGFSTSLEPFQARAAKKEKR
jgi:hypothetical protein